MRKYIRFCLFEIKDQIHGRRSIVFIITATIALTMASVLILINILRTSVLEIEEINRQKCIYYPNLCVDLPWNEMKDEMRHISHAFDSGELPSIISCDYQLRLHNENDTVIVNDRSYVSVGLTVIPDIDFIFSNDEYEKIKEEIIAGEMPDPYRKNEIPRIIISEETRDNYFKDADIGGMIPIGDRQYCVAAIVASDKNYVLGADLETDFDAQLLINSFIFSEPLNNSQREYYHIVLSKYAGSEDVNLYETRRFGEIMTYATYCAIVLLLLFFCMVTVMRLFRYIFTDRLYVYNIYKIHGIRRSGLMMVLTSDILLITICASVLGILLFMLSKPLQRYFQIDRNIPPEIMTAVVAGMLFVAAVTAFPIISKLAEKPPLDREFWR